MSEYATKEDVSREGRDVLVTTLFIVAMAMTIAVGWLSTRLDRLEHPAPTTAGEAEKDGH